MAFKTDGGGLAFSADDAKLACKAATWATHLTQLGKMKGQMWVMTRNLPDVDYISEIIGKRPWDISILAHTDAFENALLLRARFPRVQFALHPRNNAKMVLVAPKTVWLSSADFGKSTDVESGLGLHSTEAFDTAFSEIFLKAWNEARAI